MMVLKAGRGLREHLQLGEPVSGSAGSGVQAVGDRVEFDLAEYTQISFLGQVPADESNAELQRQVRQAQVLDGLRVPPPPLLHAVLVAAKPDWWTMTGWESSADALGQPTCAYQQSWILIPKDTAG